jgi:hypothetical protein
MSLGEQSPEGPSALESMAVDNYDVEGHQQVVEDIIASAIDATYKATPVWRFLTRRTIRRNKELCIRNYSQSSRPSGVKNLASEGMILHGELDGGTVGLDRAELHTLASNLGQRAIEGLLIHQGIFDKEILRDPNTGERITPEAFIRDTWAPEYAAGFVVAHAFRQQFNQEEGEL